MAQGTEAGEPRPQITNRLQLSQAAMDLSEWQDLRVTVTTVATPTPRQQVARTKAPMYSPAIHSWGPHPTAGL